MQFTLDECRKLSNITEEDAYRYFIKITKIINEKDINISEVLDCIINIISSYSTGYYAFPIPELEKIENWILQIWDPFSLETTEQIIFIALNLQLKKICNKIREYYQDKSLSQEVLQKLQDSIEEINHIGLCQGKNQNETYF